MRIVTLLLFVAANFVWLLLVVGGLMTWVMPRNANRNKIILSTAAVLSVLLTFAIVERGPDEDDGISSNCRTSRMADSCY
jgi:hypothetical protein